MSQNSKKLESLKYKMCFVYRLEIIKRLKNHLKCNDMYSYHVLVINPLQNLNLANTRLI